MNHVYRIVWNNAVRAWVAVAESARGRGKGGARRARPGQPSLTHMLAVASAATAALLAAHADAQTAVAAPGQQTNVFVSPNGVTVVNIANPNAAGLSHNRYQQFNVGPQGLVLNNTTPSQITYSSQLAGQVIANYNMASQAGVILNEVVSNNRSQLAGFTEVLGRRADVVLANPYGITCSGCGFINTDRVTLSTGTPFLRADGSLGGFNVSQGDILVNGGGLNASAQQLLELVTRSVKLEANVNAPQIEITTGTNQWDYGTRAITGSVGATGSAPTYSIDSSALGGMYANRIKISSTEAGVGVRMLGDAAASAEDFTLSAAGRVELGSRISAQRDVLVASSSNEAAAIALQDASLTAARDAKLVASQGGLALERSMVVAGASIEAAGTRIDAGQGSRLQAAQARAARATASDLALGATAVRAGTDMQLATSGQLSIAAGEGQGVQSTGGSIRIDAGNGLVNDGVISADQGSLTVRAGDELSNGGTLNAGQSINIADAGGASLSLDNRGNIIAGQSMTTQAADVSNSGWLQAGISNSIDAANLANSGKIIAATGSATLRVDGMLDNSGSVRAGQDVAIAGRNGGAVQQLVNSGDLLAARALRIDAQALHNLGAGWIQATAGSIVNAASIDNAGTWLTSQQAGASDRITVGGSLVNSGTMQSAGDLAVAAGSLDNRKAIVASGALRIDASGSIANAAGALLTGTSLSAAAGQDLDNDGTINAGASTTVRADGNIDNSGQLLSDGSMSVKAGGLLSNQTTGWVQAQSASTVEAGSLNNQGVWLLSSRAGAPASQVTVGGTLTNTGALQAREDAQLTAARIENQSNALIRTGGSLGVNFGAGGLSNAGALQAGDGTAGNGALLRLNGAAGSTLSNLSTGLMLGDTLQLLAGDIRNAGAIQGGAGASSMTATGSLTNSGSGVLTMASVAGGSGSITTGRVDNDGTVQSAGSLAVAVGSLDSDGNILADGNLDVQGQGGGVLNATIGGTVQTNAALTVSGSGASSLKLNGSAIGQTVDVAMADGSVAIGAQGLLNAQGQLDLNARSLTLAAEGTGATAKTGRILGATAAAAGTQVSVKVGSDLRNDGLVFSGRNLRVEAPNVAIGSTGAISALETLDLEATAGQLDLAAAAPAAGAGRIDNAGLIYAGVQLNAQANGELANSGDINSDGSLFLRANTLTNNRIINAAQDATIVAARLRNEAAGADGLVRTVRDSDSAHVEIASRDDKKSPGVYDGGNKDVAWLYEYTYNMRQEYTGALPTIKPQITAGNNMLLAFNNGSNKYGVISAVNDLQMQGFSLAAAGAPNDGAAFGIVDDKGQSFKLSGASFLNDNLALTTTTYTVRYSLTTKYIVLGPETDYENRLCYSGMDAVCYTNGYETTPGTPVVTSNPNTGLYANKLIGTGFSLTNNGATQAVGSGQDITAVRRAAGPSDLIDARDEAGDKTVARESAIGALPAVLERPAITGPGAAPTVAGMNFLDANAANGVKGTSFGGITLELPTNPNGYFVIAQTPGSRYLVETNPLYLGGSSAVGSDYLSKLLGYNPDELSMRLGDASYEVWLVKQQLIAQTGNAVLASYRSADGQMKDLMEHAASQSKSLGLTYGKALTPQQQAALKQDIVWMVQTVVDGKTVLAPVVYLSQSTKAGITAGAVISAETANLSLESLTNTGGTLIGSKSLVVASTGDISNLSGLIKGGDVSLTSTEGSIINKTLSTGGGGDHFYSTVLGKTAGIESTGSLTLDAKKDIANIGASMNAGGDASLKAGNNITFDTIEKKDTNSKFSNLEVKNGSGYTSKTTTTVNQVKSGLTVGGNLAMQSGNDITLAGTDAKVGGNADLNAGNNLNIVARENSTVTHSESKSSGLGMNDSLYGSTTTTSDSTSIRNVGSSFTVGGDASFTAKNDMTVQGSDVNVAGSGAINAANVNVLAGRNYDETTTTTKKTGAMQVGASGKGSADADSASGATSGRGRASAGAEASAGARGQGSAGLALSSTTTTTSATTDLKHVGSNLNFGKDLTVTASKDVTLQGSKIDAGGNVGVEAQNVYLLAAQDKSTSTTTTTTTKVGLMASTDNQAGAGAQAGAQAAGGKGTPSAGAQASAEASAKSENRVDLVQQTKSSTSTLDITHQGSAISSGGNLTVNAKDKLALEGSSMKTGGDMALSATNMSFTAVNDVHEVRTSSEKTTAGLYVTGTASAKAGANADAALGAQAGAKAEASAGVEMGLYGSNTKSNSVEGSTTAMTSSLSSGGNITRKAGNNITDQGTQISGGGSLIQEAKTIDSLAAANTTYGSSDSTTHTARIGAYAEASVSAQADAAVGPGASQPTRKQGGGGAGVRASYEYGNETASSSSSTAVVSTINMGGSVQSTSSGKTTMEGTQIAAGKDVSLAASSLDYKAAANTSSEKSSSKDAGASVGVDIVNKEVSVGVSYSGSNSQSQSSTAVVGGISAGGNFSVKTTGDTRLEGTNIAAGGAASIDAGGKVDFAAAKNTASSSSQDVGVEAGVTVGKKGGAGSAQVGYGQSKSSLNEDVAGSIASGGPLSIKSGGDATFTGTAIASQSDVSIAAGGNVAFNAARRVEESSSLAVGVSAAGGSNTKKVGRTTDASTGKKTGGTAVRQSSGAASLDVGSTKSSSDTATAGSISSGGGSIRIASGGNTTLEGTQVAAAQGITADVGGTFTQKAAVSTSSSSTVGFSAAGSGYSQTPTKKPGATTTPTTPTTTTTPQAPVAPATPAPTPATPSKPAGPPSTPPPKPPGASSPPSVAPPPTPTTGASKPPAAPPPLTPTQATLQQANNAGTAGSASTTGAKGANNAALTQQKGSGIVDVYVDNQKSTTTQAVKMDGGAGGIVINQGKAAGGQPQTISASVPIPATPGGAKPVAKTADGKALPSWLKFDPATGKFEGKPPADFKGELKVNVSVPQPDGSTKSVPMVFSGK